MFKKNLNEAFSQKIDAINYLRKHLVTFQENSCVYVNTRRPKEGLQRNEINFFVKQIIKFKNNN